MPIKFYLQPNPITPDLMDQSARVSSNTTIYLEDLVNKGGKTRNAGNRNRCESGT